LSKEENKRSFKKFSNALTPTAKNNMLLL